MNENYPKAKPSSDEGGVLIDGLYVNPAGHTEPIFVLRASEPAVVALMLTVMRDMQNAAYTPEFMRGVELKFEEMQRWRSESGLPARRVADVVVYDSKLLPAQEKVSKKK